MVLRNRHSLRGEAARRVPRSNLGHLEEAHSKGRSRHSPREAGKKGRNRQRGEAARRAPRSLHREGSQAAACKSGYRADRGEFIW